MKPIAIALLALLANAAQAGDLTIRVDGVDKAEGQVMVALYHDANGNGKMDRNAMGIPSEAYAFSNNALGMMGPPSFDQVKFAVPQAGATVTVSLR